MATTKNRGAQKEVFLHLLMIGFLYVNVIAFIALLFQFINYAFPDFLDFNQYRGGEGLHWPLAALVIIYPAFLLTSWLISKDFEKHPEKREGRVRKWLLYFTLFAATITIIADLVTLVLHFLEGELTSRFLLKSFSVLVVIGIVFGYYLREIKKEKQFYSKNEKMFVWVLSAVIAIAVISGFVLAGSPFKQRIKRFDNERVSHLQTIQWNIVAYWQQKGRIPDNLDELSDPIAGFNQPRDPVTQQLYEYEKIGDTQFKLCATFQSESDDFARAKQDRTFTPEQPEYAPYGQLNGNWQHGKGKICFERTIDPDRYPVLPKSSILPSPAPKEGSSILPERALPVPSE